MVTLMWRVSLVLCLIHVNAIAVYAGDATSGGTTWWTCDGYTYSHTQYVPCDPPTTTTTGGASTGGTSTGGASTGGTSTASTGGASTGGTSTASTGGASTGGVSTSGTITTTAAVGGSSSGSSSELLLVTSGGIVVTTTIATSATSDNDNTADVVLMSSVIGAAALVCFSASVLALLVRRHLQQQWLDCRPPPDVEVAMSLSGDTALTLGVSMASIVVELHPVYEADVLYNGDVDDNALYEHLRAPTTVVTNAVYQRHVDSALYLRGIEVASGANSVVGKGSGGCVYRGMWHGSTEVALKQTSEDTLTNEQFYKEAALCKDYRHPHVVQFFGLFVEPANACHFMVMEFMHNGSLDSYLASQTQCTWPVRRQMALDVCKGMIYLHECALIHRDLAARNVLVDATGKCKVADFGLSQTLNAHSDKLYCTLPENTMAAVRWTAPEALSTQRYSYASDVWSMGVLLWELATQCEHRYPYPQLARNSDVRCAVIDERQTMDGQQDWPPGWYQWMAACWRYEPSERCTMKELYAAMTPKTEASDACRFMSDVQPDHVYENVK